MGPSPLTGKQRKAEPKLEARHNSFIHFLVRILLFYFFI